MPELVRVKSPGNGKICNFDIGDNELKIGDNVIIETDKGIILGDVVGNPKSFDPEKQEVRKIIRVATASDLKQSEKLKIKEKEAFNFCLKKIEEREMYMKLIKVEYLHTGNKAIFYFSAEGRVDFRNLVKDLASKFKIRIEMCQVGVRDESKIIGGIGSCGRVLCCNSFLHSFDAISIRMAKEQHLALNPQKVSGLCGRLMCCLVYEYDNYKYCQKRLPQLGRVISTPKGDGVVIGIKTLEEKLKVQLLKENAIGWFKSNECSKSKLSEKELSCCKDVAKIQSKYNNQPYEDNEKVAEDLKLLEDSGANTDKGSSKPRHRPKKQGYNKHNNYKNDNSKSSNSIKSRGNEKNKHDNNNESDKKTDENDKIDKNKGGRFNPKGKFNKGRGEFHNNRSSDNSRTNERKNDSDLTNNRRPQGGAKPYTSSGKYSKNRDNKNNNENSKPDNRQDDKQPEREGN